MNAAIGLCLTLLMIQDGPDPREIPVPRIQTPMGTLPSVRELPVRPEMPPVMVMNDGTRVKTRAQWQRRREEMRRTLAYYAVGQMPPAPGNVKGREARAETLLDGTVKYRLVELTFGPQGKLRLNIGIFTPVKGGPFPAIILQGGTPPGAEPLPRLPQGPNQGKGENVLLMVGPAPTPETMRPGMPPPTAEAMARQRADVFRRGYALVVFNPNDCAEDTTLRNADGSWAFRTTRFFPAYPGYDWGVLAGWAWGASRVADYLEKDPDIDARKLIITGASRNGKASMIAAAFDDRLMGAPVVTGGGGVGAFRFAGARRSETLDIMVKKYPNWFSPNLHEFWGHREKLPFDAHWFLALAAPRPFIALEGETDTISLPEAVRATMRAAQPAYDLFGVKDGLGVNYAKHGHAFTDEDWTAMMDFFDARVRGKQINRDFTQFPAGTDAGAVRARALEVVQAKAPTDKLKHSLAVEQMMRELATGPEDDKDDWALAGLLHDIDLAATANNLARHGIEGARMLAELGYSAGVIHAVQAHDDRAGVERTSRMDHALYCADQMYWAKAKSAEPSDKVKAECAVLKK